MTSNGYFTGATGKHYAFADIAGRIRKDAPHTLGKHIFEQLAAIGLLEEMQNGTTPCGLPYSFARDPGPVRKQLTSSGMVHTPGLFRALRNDYRIKGEPRRRAIKILSDVYGMPPGEAERLLGGAIGSRGIPAHAFPADWATHGKAAGFRRNGAMLREGPPDCVATRQRAYAYYEAALAEKNRRKSIPEPVDGEPILVE